MSTERFDKVIARADRVMQQLDERDGAVRDAARRERQRLNASVMRRVTRVGVAIGIIIGIAARPGILPTGKGRPAGPAADLPNGQIVQQVDSYLYRKRAALP